MGQSPYATSIVREAVQGTVGGSLIWVLSCAIAGVVTTAATADSFDVDWSWAFAWIGHLVVAGIQLWGLVVICIHVLCLAALIHGTERVLRVVVITFISQLTTSAIVTVSFEHDALWREVMAWVACAIPALMYLIGCFVTQRHDQT